MPSNDINSAYLHYIQDMRGHRRRINPRRWWWLLVASSPWLVVLASLIMGVTVSPVGALLESGVGDRRAARRPLADVVWQGEESTDLLLDDMHTEANTSVATYSYRDAATRRVVFRDVATNESLWSYANEDMLFPVTLGNVLVLFHANYTLSGRRYRDGTPLWTSPAGVRCNPALGVGGSSLVDQTLWLSYAAAMPPNTTGPAPLVIASVEVQTGAWMEHPDLAFFFAVRCQGSVACLIGFPVSGVAIIAVAAATSTPFVVAADVASTDSKWHWAGTLRAFARGDATAAPPTRPTVVIANSTAVAALDAISGRLQWNYSVAPDYIQHVTVSPGAGVPGEQQGDGQPGDHTVVIVVTTYTNGATHTAFSIPATNGTDTQPLWTAQDASFVDDGWDGTMGTFATTTFFGTVANVNYQFNQGINYVYNVTLKARSWRTGAVMGLFITDQNAVSSGTAAAGRWAVLMYRSGQPSPLVNMTALRV